jgi:YD repeat-containing protein
MEDRSGKLNKIFKSSVFIAVFTIFIVLLSSNAQATMHTLMEWYPGDYSFRSGLELKTQYYNGSNKLVKEIEYFYDTKAPLIGSATKLYNGVAPTELHTDNISWVVKGYPAKSLSDTEVDYAVAISPRLQGKLTKLYNPVNGQYKQYYTGYERDQFGNVRIEKNYGELIPSEPVSKDYIYESTFFPPDPLNPWQRFTKLTTLHGILNIDDAFDNQQVFDAFPQDNTITKTEYLYEHEYYDFRRDLIRNNLLSLPDTKTTTDFFGRQLSKIYYGHVMGNAQLGWCGNAGPYGHEALMFNPFYAPSSYRYGDLVGEIINYESILGSFPLQYLTDWVDIAEFSYDMCGNSINTTTTNPYVANGARKVSENYVQNYYGSGNDYYSSKYNVPLSVISYGNSTSNTPLVKNAGYYTFNTAYTKCWVPPGITTDYRPVRIPHNLDYITVPSTKVKNITDENGVTTYYEYDVLGRITKITVEPDDPVTSFTKRYTYFTQQGSEWKVLIEEKINSSITKQTFYIYDGLGRLKQTQIKKDSSTIIVSDIKYDKLGRKEKESKQHEITATFGTYQQPDWTSLESAKLVIKYGYDTLSRIVTITYPDGSKIKKVYSDDENKITIYDENNHWKNYYYDASNNLIKVEEQQP